MQAHRSSIAGNARSSKQPQNGPVIEISFDEEDGLRSRKYKRAKSGQENILEKSQDVLKRERQNSTFATSMPGIRESTRFSVHAIGSLDHMRPLSKLVGAR
jgi:hypothetical protein